MNQFTRVKNLSYLRAISRIFPLKHKLSFLIGDYIKDGNKLAIKYYRDWYVCTTVSKLTRSTIEEVILGGVFSQPEASLIKKLRDKLPNDMVMVDVGGNIGTFFAQFLDKCQKVFVFEPIPRLYEVIRSSIEYNADRKIQLIPKAVGDSPATLQMLDNNNSNIVTGKVSEDVVDIVVTTLDIELSNIDKIDFIKIDVEGYEVSVLNGARKVIEKHRPYILVEVHPGYLKNYQHDSSEVISFLEDFNYKISYYSFLEELRMPKWKRIFSRWMGNKGIEFISKHEFLKDTVKEPRLSSYHFYCEPV